MDSEEFRQRGREMVDYIIEYMETLGERRVTPSIEPGYLRELIPKNAPNKGEKWKEIMSDVESKIMPGVSASLLLYNHYMQIVTVIVHRAGQVYVTLVLDCGRWPTGSTRGFTPTFHRVIRSLLFSVICCLMALEQLVSLG